MEKLEILEKKASSEDASIFYILISSLRMGGAEQCVINLASSMLSLGLSVKIITISPSGLSKQPEKISKIVDVIPISSVHLLPFFLACLIDQKRNTVLISSFWTITIAASIYALFNSRCRLLYWEHAPSTNYTWMSKILIGLLFNRVDYIIGWRGSIDGLLKIFPSFAKKVFYTGNPIRLPKNGILAPTIKRQAGILCMVGRLELSKGILRTLYSLLLVESGDSPRMIVVGDGSAKLQFLQLVSDLGLSHRVWLLGSVPDATDYMRLSSVLIMLSQTEGFCNVVVESLAVGTPVVTLNNGSVAKSLIKDISHGAVLDHCDVLEVARLVEFYCDLKKVFNPIPEVMQFESDEWTNRLLEFLEQKKRRE